MTDHALDALLAEYVAPPVPAGLAGRVAAAALALPQEPLLAHARRAGAMTRHDRRGKWLRRPFLLGGVALGLAVSGAVAATLAGLRVDWPAVEAVLADLPFLGREAPADPVPPPSADPPGQAPPAVEPAPAGESRAATRAEEAPSATSAVGTRAEAPSIAAPEPEPAPRRSEFVDPRLAETRPAAPLAAPAGDSARDIAPPPVAAERSDEPAPVAEPRTLEPGVDESARLRQERIERAERLRAARQAQIERLQRVQQRRERLRRLQRN
jgi:hypothetical protein